MKPITRFLMLCAVAMAAQSVQAETNPMRENLTALGQQSDVIQVVDQANKADKSISRQEGYALNRAWQAYLKDPKAAPEAFTVLAQNTMNKTLQNWVESSGKSDIETVVLLNNTGESVSHSGLTERYWYGNLSAWKKPMAGEASYEGRLQRRKGEKREYLDTISVPVQQAGKKPVGVLLAYLKS